LFSWVAARRNFLGLSWSVTAGAKDGEVAILQTASRRGQGTSAIGPLATKRHVRFEGEVLTPQNRERRRSHASVPALIEIGAGVERTRIAIVNFSVFVTERRKTGPAGPGSLCVCQQCLPKSRRASHKTDVPKDLLAGEG